MPTGILITFIAVFLLIFPLFVSVFISADKNGKTFKAEITLFGITVFKINLKMCGLKLIIKKTLKKPYVVAISPEMHEPKGFIKIKRMTVLSAELTLNIGLNEDLILIETVSLFRMIENTAVKVITAYKPYFRYASKVNCLLGENRLQITLQLKTVFNLTDIVAVLFKNLSEKILYAIGKQQNKQCG